MAKIYFVFFILSLFRRVVTAEDVSLQCTLDFCEEYVQRFPCPPLDPACSNSTISLVLPSPTVCNCCEQCFLFQGEGEDCVVGRPGIPPPKVMCGPGTTCHAGKCKKMTTPDPDFYRGYECKDGKCHCSVIEDNAVRKTFGSFHEEDIKGEKQCECAISAHAARKLINKFLPVSDAFLSVPRCLPNGQFDPLQCFNDLCGCVNRTTGVWDSTVRRVPVSALGPNSPKCFDKTIHKVGQYYTECEKETNSLMSDLSWADSGEIEVLITRKVRCNPDGNYANSQ